jgi:hypothetical protein
MMASDQAKGAWFARYREKQRLKRERTGDTEQKVAEGRRTTKDPTVKDTVGKAPLGGGMIGGGPVGM